MTGSVSEEWLGQERRSIPVHVLNHIDERLATHTERVSKVVADHTREEMDRYKEILDKIDAHRADSEDRHGALSDAFAQYASKMDDFCHAISQAFPKDDEGKPDFRGHGQAHASWMANSERDKSLLAYVETQKQKDEDADKDIKYYKRAVISAVAVIVVLWVGNLIWAGAAQGPLKAPTEKVSK